jgi:hypothetical protein
MTMNVLKGNKLKFASILVVLTMLFSLTVSFAAIPSGLGIEAKFSKQTGVIGDEITATVKFNKTAELNGTQFVLSYNSTVLQLAASPYTLLAPIANYLVIKSDDDVTNLTSVKAATKGKGFVYIDDKTAGKITVIVGTHEDANRSFTDGFLTIAFKAIANGTSDIDFTTGTNLTSNWASAYDATKAANNEVAFVKDVTTTKDTVEIGSTSPTATPAPGSGGGGTTTEKRPSGDNNVLFVPDNTLNSEHARYLYGYGDGTVKPDGKITREESAAVYYRLLRNEIRTAYKKTTTDFSDVENSRWSTESIGTLANAKYILGYADGTFQPANAITRAEFVTLAVRFGGNANGSTVRSFNDVSGHWAADSIAIAASKGWINGYEDGSFAPDNNVTRAEAVTIINRLLERHTDAQGVLVNIVPSWSDLSIDHWAYYEIAEATVSHTYTRRAVGNLVENWTGKATDLQY